MPPSSTLLLRTSISLLTSLPLLIFLNDHVGKPMRIVGPSMAPALSPDYASARRADTVWAKMWAPAKGLRRGMMVAFWAPHDPTKIIIKRVVALEGDHVMPRERYPVVQELEVPPGHVWVEGDDGFRTLDSNDYGPVSMSLIVGQITHVIWPWARAGPIKWWEWKNKKNVFPVDIQRPIILDR